MPHETRESELRSDLELLRRAEGGARAAFSALVERHQDAVYRFARSLGFDPAEAEDTLQETFVSAWRHAAQFRGEGSVRGWLLSIARNGIRSRRRRRTEVPVADDESLEALGRAAGWGAEAESLGDVLDRKDAVQRALSALSAQDREILILRDVEGFSGEETSAVLELKLPAVKSRLHRARLRLAAALREGGFHGPGS